MSVLDKFMNLLKIDTGDVYEAFPDAELTHEEEHIPFTVENLQASMLSQIVYLSTNYKLDNIRFNMEKVTIDFVKTTEVMEYLRNVKDKIFIQKIVGGYNTSPQDRFISTRVLYYVLDTENRPLKIVVNANVVFTYLDGNAGMDLTMLMTLMYMVQDVLDKSNLRSLLPTRFIIARNVEMEHVHVTKKVNDTVYCSVLSCLHKIPDCFFKEDPIYNMSSDNDHSFKKIVTTMEDHYGTAKVYNISEYRNKRKKKEEMKNG